ncbi:hypothetical protein HPB47_015363, partial [Ixodes persulcatus]
DIAAYNCMVQIVELLVNVHHLRNARTMDSRDTREPKPGLDPAKEHYIAQKNLANCSGEKLFTEESAYDAYCERGHGVERLKNCVSGHLLTANMLPRDKDVADAYIEAF